MVGYLRLHESRVVSIAHRLRQVQGQRFSRRPERPSSARVAQLADRLIKCPKRQHGSLVFGAAETVEREDEDVLSLSETAVGLDAQRRESSIETAAAIVVYVHPEIAPLRNMVAAARSRLAEIETNYTRDRCAVEATQAKLFNLVREHYQRRDRLRLIVAHRRKYLKVLIASGDEEAAQVDSDYEKARAQSDSNYEGAARAATNKKELSAEQETELKTLWKKLVRSIILIDFAGEANTFDTYEKLMSAINRAKEEGDVELLREIANDPTGFVLRQGWTGSTLAMRTRSSRYGNSSTRCMPRSSTSSKP